ncbi:MFS transporter [Melittangium boletus]|uniref:MFS transporter permease n=1 Tax=Melittangium boletus DSM 14713 TaxID=1294270 RepID=A0A250IJ75_9BACT|nr:MFS transporter [Melittangium boletus]ATB31874.1 MFS transporter permease [Melittangium boletus DSM 14713]
MSGEALPAEAHVEEHGLSTRTLLALGFTALLVPLNSTMIAVALPTIGHEFGAGLGTLSQWLVTSYLLVNIVLQSPGGKLGDVWGHRRVLTLGQVMFTLGALAGFFAQHVAMLALARMLMAAGGAVISPSSMAILRNGLPLDRRARAFGMFGALITLAAALGPMIGGELVSRLGWPSIFLVNVPILLLSALATRVGAPPEPIPTQRPAFDIMGSVLLGLGLGLIIVGTKSHGAWSVGLPAVGLVLLGVMYRWERKQRHPVIDFQLFRSRAFTAGSAVIALQNLAMYGMLFQLPYLFTQRFGEDTGRTGRTMLAMMIMMTIGTPLGGRLSEKLGARATAVTGALLGLAGMTILGVRTVDSPNEAILPLMLLGFGLSLGNAPSQASALSSVDRTRTGMAAGVMSTTRYLGGVVGIAILGGLLTQGAAAATERQHHGAIAVFGVSLALSAVAALALPRRETAR